MSIQALWFVKDTNPPSGNETINCFAANSCPFANGEKHRNSARNKSLLVIVITPVNDRYLRFIRRLESFQSLGGYRGRFGLPEVPSPGQIRGHVAGWSLNDYVQYQRYYSVPNNRNFDCFCDDRRCREY